MPNDDHLDSKAKTLRVGKILYAYGHYITPLFPKAVAYYLLPTDLTALRSIHFSRSLPTHFRNILRPCLLQTITCHQEETSNMRSSSTSILAVAAMASSAFAKTDLSGCTTTDMSSPAGASVAWYVPGTGELCDMLDCGGGRAPPKTDVPGCPSYSGTASYSPSYLPGYQAAATGALSTTAVSVTASPSITASSSFSTSISGFPDVSGLDTSESSWDLYTTNGALPPGTVSSAEVSALTSAATVPRGQLPTSTGYNGTSPTPGPVSGNGTLANGTRPSGSSGGGSGSGSGSSSRTTSSMAGAATAQVGGLVLGLGALVAAL